MQVALRKRYLDAMLAELGFECPKVGGASASGALRALAIDPHEQQEIQAVVTVLDEPDVGFTAGHMG